jgi:phage terminase large subunit-like protein
MKKSVTVCQGQYTDAITYDPDAGYWRNPARAERVIAFIECLTIPSGVGAGTPFKLRPWQRDYIRDIYERCDEAGRRIVRQGVLSMARKNGKTAIIAAMVLVHLVGPEAILNGEIYSAANDKEQAAIIYKFAAQFVRADPEIDAAEGGLLSCVDSTKRIVCRSNGSYYRALSREMKTKHGLNPSFAIYDELAQAIDRDLFDTLNTADSARDEFLFAVISTQSRDPQHILSELIDRGLSHTDPTVVCHLYAVDEEADPFDESLWPLANPALGDFKLLERMREKARDAKAMPSFMPSFLNLELNQRVDSVPSLINVADWKACHDPDAELREGEDIYLGLDLSATTDLCALAAVSAEDGNRLDAWFWKPRDLIHLHEKRDRAPYERWMTEGYLIAAPGRDVDYDLIAIKIAELAQTYRILGIAYDRWRMAVLMKCFERLEINAYYEQDADDTDGIRFVEWGQGYKDMAPAVDALDKAVAARTLAHRGHPVLTWCFSNAVATVDPAGNRKLDKSKARFRIDGAVAATMALGLKARDALEDDGDFDGFLNNPISVSA